MKRDHLLGCVSESTVVYNPSPNQYSGVGESSGGHVFFTCLFPSQKCSAKYVLNGIIVVRSIRPIKQQ